MLGWMIFRVLWVLRFGGRGVFFVYLNFIFKFVFCWYGI